MKNNEITFVGKQKIPEILMFMVLTVTGAAAGRCGFHCLFNFIGNDFNMSLKV